MPAQGDVGWDDAIRINHKMFEVAVQPILEGHCVVSGLTVYHISGASIWWDGGYVKFNGGSTEYYVESGATTPENNTITWLSAVTESIPSGATIQERATEYDIPSSASGFAHVPIAVVWMEAGSVARVTDLRYRPVTSHAMDQDVASGSTPTFGGVYVVDMVDAANGNFRSGITVVSGTSDEGEQPNGALYIDTNDKLLQVGLGGASYGIPFESLIETVIASPDLLDNPSQIPLFTVPGGVSYFITGATVYADTSGNTVPGIVYSTSQYNWTFGSGSTIYKDVEISNSGTSVWYIGLSGGTVIPENRTVLMEWGQGTPGIIKIDFAVRRVAGP